MRLAAICLLSFPLILTGCALKTTAPPSQITGANLTGNVHGGQQAVSGTRVYLLAANTTGQGSASVSLLDRLVTLKSPDVIGSYVTTDKNGYFAITGTYQCTPDQDVYIYAQGGNAGAGISSAIGLMAVLGPCTDGTFLAEYPFVQVNEVTTIAAAYALSGFATDAVHISSSGTSAAKGGVNNAFLTAASLADVSTGTAVATTASGGTVDAKEINTLANILAACLNTSGAITGPSSPTSCYTLFTNTRAGGTTGIVPNETATAAINIAHHPGTNVGALFLLPSPTAPFGNALTKQPNDFSIAIGYPTGGYNLAIDASGSVWMTGFDNLFEIANNGTQDSPADGFTGGGMEASDFNVLSGIAIDQNGNVWVANVFAGIAELDNKGVPITSDDGITTGGISFPYGIAVDGYGSVWIANYYGTVSKLSSSGAPLSPDQGYVIDGNSSFNGIAIDAAENVWISGQSGLNKLSNCGAPTSGITDCTPVPTSAVTNCGHATSPSTPYTGGDLNMPLVIAVDAGSNIWAANTTGSTTASFTEISNTGCALSGPNGYSGATGTTAATITGLAIDGDGNVWEPTTTGIASLSPAGVLQSPANGYISSTTSNPASIGIDSSGNVWVTNETTTEFVGAAAPVVTPLAVAVQQGKVGARP